MDSPENTQNILDQKIDTTVNNLSAKIIKSHTSEKRIPQPSEPKADSLSESIIVDILIERIRPRPTESAILRSLKDLSAEQKFSQLAQESQTNPSKVNETQAAAVVAAQAWKEYYQYTPKSGDPTTYLHAGTQTSETLRPLAKEGVNLTTLTERFSTKLQSPTTETK